jgi:hypothetical protein
MGIGKKVSQCHYIGIVYQICGRIARPTALASDVPIAGSKGKGGISTAVTGRISEAKFYFIFHFMIIFEHVRRHTSGPSRLQVDS